MAVQTCDQAITFRNFNYARALEVVQDEEYLDDVDFDDIRLRRKQGEVFKAIDYFNEKIENNLLPQSCGSTDDTIVTTGIDLDFPNFINFSPEPEVEGDAQNLQLCYTAC